MATNTKQWLELRKTAGESLERMQIFDVTQLPREGDLGKLAGFGDVLDPAKRIVELYKRLPASVLDDLSTNLLTQVRDNANADFNRFDAIQKFDPKQQNANDVRQNQINQVIGAYDSTFNALHPIIAYSLQKTADFGRLENEGRATLQGIKDEADAIKKALDSQRQDAEKVLKEIRDVAAEQGVSQQANYFRNAADQHDTESEKWRTLTIKLVFLLGVYALLSLVIHKIPFLHPGTTFEAVQISISKVLIFAVISFMLYLAARNFLAHKHNAIVNRHRQNALLTYKALVEGSGDKAISDAVLMYAASCIYGSQPTGYTSQEHGDAAGAKSVIELLSKPIAK